MFPGGFSAGDEPDGSGKFMATLFRNPYLAEGLENLLYKQDGLVLGICNGFQALIKLGLLPGGHIETLTADHPTLTYNTIGRHVSRMANTKVISTKSPWMCELRLAKFIRFLFLMVKVALLPPHNKYWNSIKLVKSLHNT